jgi:transcription elongation factor GreA
MQNSKTATVPEVVYLTKKTFQEYEVEVDRLQAEHSIVMKRLIEAREMGDLSENGAYQYAKFELAAIKRKLSRLRAILSQAQVLQKSGTTSSVELGSTVTVLANKKTATYTIVSQHEADPSQQTISDKSPLGNALIGKKLQSVVTVASPRGNTSYTITAIA